MVEDGHEKHKTGHHAEPDGDASAPLHPGPGACDKSTDAPHHRRLTGWVPRGLNSARRLDHDLGVLSSRAGRNPAARKA